MLSFSTQIRAGPSQPHVNAGAITVASLLHQKLGNNALTFLLDRFSEAAGRKLTVSEAVYRSEAQTGQRNRAIAHLLLNVGAAREPIEPALDLYFRQCSILVTASDLARMGATLANLGESYRAHTRDGTAMDLPIMVPSSSTYSSSSPVDHASTLRPFS